jgi:hypothetical protein
MFMVPIKTTHCEVPPSRTQEKQSPNRSPSLVSKFSPACSLWYFQLVTINAFMQERFDSGGNYSRTLVRSDVSDLESSDAEMVDGRDSEHSSIDVSESEISE